MKELIQQLYLDHVYLSIGEKWVLLMVALALNLADIQIIFGVIATMAVIVYTTLKAIDVNEDIKDKRLKRKKNGTPDSN